MRDGPGRRAVKAAARGAFTSDLKIRRALGRRNLSRFALTGSCEGCGRCCEEPTMAVGRAIRSLPTLRRAFLAWQRRVNGFEFVREERGAFVFTCTHYDPETRSCDSYDSRPAICRDYPQGLLDQPWPELFPECTYKLVVRDAARLLDGLASADLTEEQRTRLEERLRLK